jgi:hypothetical protein
MKVSTKTPMPGEAKTGETKRMQPYTLNLYRLTSRRVVSMSQDSFKVAAIQMDFKARDKNTNITRALELITNAAKEGAKLMVLPELFTSGYYCFRTRDPTLFEEAETIPGHTTAAIG